MKTASAAMKVKRVMMMSSGMRAATGLAQGGGRALIAMEGQRGQAGGARAICGPLEGAVVGAAIGKAC